jgi:hypothetical protein
MPPLLMPITAMRLSVCVHGAGGRLALLALDYLGTAHSRGGGELPLDEWTSQW